MDREQGGQAAKLHRKIAVAHRVHRILGEDGAALEVHEAEFFRDELAVERQGRARDGPASERTNIHADETPVRPLMIPFQHLDISEQMMGEINGLRPLEMSVSGNDDVWKAPA